MKRTILFSQGVMMVVVAATAFGDIGRFNVDEFYSSPAFIAGIFLELIGLAIALIAVRTMKSNLTIHVDPRDELVMRGIFRISRNPIYVGGLLMCAGWALMFHSWLCALATLILAIVLNIKIRMEECALTDKFGATYINYQSKTRRWL